MIEAILRGKRVYNKAFAEDFIAVMFFAGVGYLLPKIQRYFVIRFAVMLGVHVFAVIIYRDFVVHDVSPVIYIFGIKIWYLSRISEN
jgi:hypothetical protein